MRNKYTYCLHNMYTYAPMYLLPIEETWCKHIPTHLYTYEKQGHLLPRTYTYAPTYLWDLRAPRPIKPIEEIWDLRALGPNKTFEEIWYEK